MGKSAREMFEDIRYIKEIKGINIIYRHIYLNDKITFNKQRRFIYTKNIFLFPDEIKAINQ